MLKYECPLSPATVEFSEADKDLLDMAADYFDQGDVAKGGGILEAIGYGSGCFVSANTDSKTAGDIKESLIVNLRPEIAEHIKDAFEIGWYNQALGSVKLSLVGRGEGRK